MLVFAGHVFFCCLSSLLTSGDVCGKDNYSLLKVRMNYLSPSEKIILPFLSLVAASVLLFQECGADLYKTLHQFTLSRGCILLKTILCIFAGGRGSEKTMLNAFHQNGVCHGLFQWI
jgi:hypothetical protein